MRPGRRRAVLGALAAAPVSLLAGSASETVASALTAGLPSIEAKVPSVEVSLGPVHAKTPETTVAVPSVEVSTATSGGSSGSGGSGGGSGSGGGGGVVVEVPVSLPSPGKEHAPGATAGESSSTPVGASKATTSTAPGASSIQSATGAPVAASSAGGVRTSPGVHPAAKHRNSTSQAGANTVPVAAAGPGTVPASAGAGTQEPQPTRNVAATERSSGNPLEAIGGHLPLPLPVPDWSKPIILLLLVLALFFAFRARMSATRAKRLETQRASLLNDLHAMQAALVPEVPAELAALGVSVAYRPADGVAAGGDFYDVFELAPGRVALVLGDVCGHGREAAERAALTRYTVRAYLQAGLEPRAALALAGQALADPDAHFATVAAGVYDAGEGSLVYACAGHPAPVVLGPGASTPLEVCCSPPVGWGIPTGRRQSRIPVPPGTAVCFFTDGLTEARCEDGLLGTERLAELLHSLGSDPSASGLVNSVTEVADATPDDMAACILVPGAAAGAGASPARIEELEFDRRDLDSGGMSRFLAGCGLAGARAAQLTGHVERALAGADTAVLQIEFTSAGTDAHVSPADESHPSRHAHPGESDGVAILSQTPAHV